MSKPWNYILGKKCNKKLKKYSGSCVRARLKITEVIIQIRPKSFYTYSTSLATGWIELGRKNIKNFHMGLQNNA